MLQAMHRGNSQSPPVWFPRQAGRYQASYRALRAQHPFEALCKKPELAARLALNAVDEFGFDAAIIFSDILFVLEALGMPLEMDPSPRLPKPLRKIEDLESMRPLEKALEYLHFQEAAVALLRRNLASDRTAFGFCGGPATLFRYASGGNHTGYSEIPSHDLFAPFCRKVLPVLTSLLARQAAAGADALIVFDTSAGLLPEEERAHKWIPAMTELRGALAHQAPGVPVLLYGRGLNAHDRQSLSRGGWGGFGLDETENLPETLAKAQGFTQGNLPPLWLTLPPDKFRGQFESWVAPIRSLPAEYKKGWIASLGHGVTPQALEPTVRLAVELFQNLTP